MFPVRIHFKAKGFRYPKISFEDVQPKQELLTIARFGRQKIQSNPAPTIYA